MTDQPLVIAPAEGPDASSSGHTLLRAWRKRQMITDPEKCRRTMRLTDVERLYGIPTTTWSQWERVPGQKGFRTPDPDNMRLLFEITGGEITPESFYPIAEWREQASGG